MAGTLKPRWYPLRHHPVQSALKKSKARFIVVPAGRRAGKTEIAKRKIVWAAGIGSKFDNPSYFCAAPTYNQAKRIYWDDLKRLVPKKWVADISESELTITLITGSRICVVGLDQPARIEGSPWDGGILDEYGNMKEKTWPAHVRPALADRNGWCWLIGVPEGRNHYYHTNLKAQGDRTGQWASFTWKSSDILPPEEIAAAKNDLDELTYLQEYEASFVVFSGRAYYTWSDANKMPLKYNPEQPIIFCFDFNAAPGVAAVLQEQELPFSYEEVVLPSGLIVRQPVVGSGCIGEVWIPQNSNTPAVCRRLIQDWGNHQGEVYVYGDATGGSGGSAKVQGSDWDLIRAEFRNSPLRDRIFYRYSKSNPRERTRLNAANSRIKSTSGVIRFMVDPAKAPHVITDFEGVRTLEGGSGEIDKKHDPSLSHVSDAITYYFASKFPTSGGIIQQDDF